MTWNGNVEKKRDFFFSIDHMMRKLKKLKNREKIAPLASSLYWYFFHRKHRPIDLKLLGHVTQMELRGREEKMEYSLAFLSPSISAF